MLCTIWLQSVVMDTGLLRWRLWTVQCNRCWLYRQRGQIAQSVFDLLIGILDMATRSLRTPFLLSGFLGLVCVIAQLKLPMLSSVSPGWQFAISIALSLPIASILTLRFGAGLPVFISFIAGVALGVLLDVAIDSQERNLFPLEIFWWWALLGPGSALGALLAGTFRKHESDTP